MYLPAAVFFGYLVLTTLLFAFGPWTYPLRSGWVYAYLAAVHVAFAAGYLSVSRTRPAFDRIGWSPRVLVTLSVLVSGLLMVPTSLLNTGAPLPDVIRGIVDPGGAYARSVNLTQRESVLTLVSYTRVIAGPILVLLWPLTIFYWRRLSVVLRALSIACVLFTIATFIAMGTNKSIADTLVIFPWILLAGHASGALRLSRRSAAALGVGWIAAMALWLSFFASTQVSRVGSSSAHGAIPVATPLVSATPTPIQTTSAPPSASPSASISPAATGTPSPTTIPTATPSRPTPRPIIARVDYDNALVQLAPAGRIQVGIIGMASYVTQGYFALSLALEKPFIPMWGVGNSFFATRQAARLLDRDEIMELPYPMRLRVDGWDPYGQWSSIYPWLASDVSFPGTIVLIFVIGRIFALAWRDALGGRNPFAVVMVALLVVMVLYFPANNQVLQFGEGFTAFWSTLFVWLLSRRTEGSADAAT
jgi:hypothetical protein